MVQEAVPVPYQSLSYYYYINLFCYSAKSVGGASGNMIKDTGNPTYKTVLWIHRTISFTDPDLTCQLLSDPDQVSNPKQPFFLPMHFFNDKKNWLAGSKLGSEDRRFTTLVAPAVK